MNFFDRFSKEHLLIAHRGFSSKFPENTKIAFENASKYADMIELDITLTKDKKVVIIHDDSLERTSNVEELFLGRDSYFVSDFYYEELLTLDFSSWFDKNITKQKIMLLEEVLDFSKENNIALNIEIKDMSNTPFDICCIDIIYNILHKQQMENNVLISSFNHTYLKRIKQIDKNISIAALFYEDEPKDLLAYLKLLDVDSYHIDISLGDKNKIEMLKNEKIFTNVYTVNDKKIKNKLFEIGIKAIFSDIIMNSE